jgi:hypothetical protein
MNERSRRLRAERDAEEKRFNSLVAAGDTEATQASLERCHELDGEIAEADSESLLGDGSPRV